jgi:TetR/AcrR family transcriptional regulator, regulator of cefoperazone and chloramphenicol sensitivity
MLDTVERSFSVLNMSSIPTSTGTTDLTAEARIRKSALELFGALGHEAVSVRAVAGDAGVSGGLVIHYFGSKVGLIEAVDNYLIERVGHYLDMFVSEAKSDGVESVLVSMAEEPALLAYLGRTILHGGVAGAMLFDRLYEMTLQFLDVMTEAGAARPVADREGTAAWLLVTDLGTLVMRHHLERILGVDPYTADGWARIASVELDMMTSPLLELPEGEER